MEVTGRCHCGRIQFRSRVDPRKISICHCTDCQILTGTAYRISAHTAVADYQALRGEPKTYVKTADSGAKRTQAFCPDCGTPLYAEALENPTVRSLRVGCLDERAALPPRRQIWCRSALAWSRDLRTIEPKFEKEGAWPSETPVR
jgi:hypothetical protein